MYCKIYLINCHINSRKNKLCDAQNKFLGNLLIQVFFFIFISFSRHITLASSLKSQGYVHHQFVTKARICKRQMRQAIFLFSFQIFKILSCPTYLDILMLFLALFLLKKRYHIRFISNKMLLKRDEPFCSLH